MAVRGAHHKLLAWQEAMSLAQVVYEKSRSFPKDEMFGLTAQMRRAAVSIPSNIAEGAARNSSRELFQFLGVAGGSLAELETQLELAVRLNYIERSDEVLEQVNRAAQLLLALRKSIKSRIEKAS